MDERRGTLSLPHTQNLISTDRTFLREGPATGIKNEDRYLYLFNDLLLVTKIKRYNHYTLKVELPMETVAAGDIPDNECTAYTYTHPLTATRLACNTHRLHCRCRHLAGGGNGITTVVQNCIELVRMDKQQRFQFIFPTSEEKRDWLRDFDAVHASFHKGDSEALERRPLYRAIEANPVEEGAAVPPEAIMQRRDTGLPLPKVSSSANITKEKKKILKSMQVCITPTTTIARSPATYVHHIVVDSYPLLIYIYHVLYTLFSFNLSLSLSFICTTQSSSSLQTIIASSTDDSSSDEDEAVVEEKKAARKWDHDSTTTHCSECKVKFTTTNRRVCSYPFSVLSLGA